MYIILALFLAVKFGDHRRKREERGTDHKKIANRQLTGNRRSDPSKYLDVWIGLGVRVGLKNYLSRLYEIVRDQKEGREIRVVRVAIQQKIYMWLFIIL